MAGAEAAAVSQLQCAGKRALAQNPGHRRLLAGQGTVAVRRKTGAGRLLRVSASTGAHGAVASTLSLRTCRQCKKPFDPATNTPESCRFHPAHYGGEIKRKWKSYKYHKVGKEFLYHSDETRAEWGEVENYWDCCGRTSPEDPGCEAGPHRSYDD